MFGKILVTAVVLFIAWQVIRARSRRGGPQRATPTVPPLPPLVSSRAMRGLAYGLVAVMVAGTGVYLFDGWASRRETVRIRVVNANTGQEVIYRARRDAVTGRSFHTLDGREVTLAEVERMEIGPDNPAP
jgi:hypothetical protein